MREVVAIRRLGQLRRAARVDRGELTAVVRAGGEHRRLAPFAGPLHVAAKIGDDRLGADLAQGRRLRVAPDERADGVPAVQQQRHDALSEAAMRTRDEDHHGLEISTPRRPARSPIAIT